MLNVDLHCAAHYESIYTLLYNLQSNGLAILHDENNKLITSQNNFDNGWYKRVKRFIKILIYPA